jgi:hypothetical protein
LPTKGREWEMERPIASTGIGIRHHIVIGENHATRARVAHQKPRYASGRSHSFDRTLESGSQIVPLHRHDACEAVSETHRVP